MSGLFHSLKKSLNKSDTKPELDREFIDLSSKFQQYEHGLVKMKGNLQSFMNHVSGLLLTSFHVANDLSTQCDDPERTTQALDNGYFPLAASLRQQHTALHQCSSSELQSSFQSSIMQPLDEEIQRTQELSKKVQERMKALSEREYYAKKMSELREERDKRAAKGKPESASDMDKFDRNQKKLDECEALFQELNTSIMNDLRRVWDRERLERMGPILQAFLALERNVAQSYTQALDGVRG